MIIYAFTLVKVKIDMVIYYNSHINLIVTNRIFFLKLKFWLYFCYFLSIKWKLLTMCYSHINGQIQKQKL